MPNTNFQTIHQMGGAINSFVKQATGRDNVQNIDMEHITVAQNHYYEDVDISGRVVSFNAGAAGIPLEKCLVQIEPVQDLHGYDHPWPAGGGENILPYPFYDTTKTMNGITFTDNGDGSITINGTATRGVNFILWDNANIQSGQTLSVASFRSGTADGNVGIYDGINGIKEKGSGNTATYSNGYTGRFRLEVYAGVTCKNYVVRPMFVLSSTLPTTYAPYSNICPISGWTKAKVFVSPATDEADGTTYIIAFPSEAGTVYGGTLDVVSGELVVDRAEVDLGGIAWLYYTSGENPIFYGPLSDIKKILIAGVVPKMLTTIYKTVGTMARTNFASHANNCEITETLNGTTVFVRNDAFTDAVTFKAAMSGVKLVYELATPITYQLTPQEVRTLLGQNNIWADTGDIEVKFTDIRGLY